MYYRGKELGKLNIQLAPTGIVPTKEENPSVPLTPDEIIGQTIQAYRMGVSSVHIHARDEGGRPTTRKEIVRKVIDMARILGREVASPQEAREILALDTRESGDS